MQEKAQAQASLREHAEYSAWAEQEVGALRAQVGGLAFALGRPVLGVVGKKGL